MDSMEQNTNLMLINVYPYYGGGEESGQPRVTKLTDTVATPCAARRSNSALSSALSPPVSPPPCMNT